MSGGPDTEEDGPSDRRRDWAITATDKVVDIVDLIRSTATQPALTATRGIVYGLLATICSVAVLAFLSIGIFRLLDELLPGESWSAYLVLGSLMCLVGGFLWTRRSTDPSTD